MVGVPVLCLEFLGIPPFLFLIRCVVLFNRRVALVFLPCGPSYGDQVCDGFQTHHVILLPRYHSLVRWWLGMLSQHKSSYHLSATEALFLVLSRQQSLSLAIFLALALVSLSRSQM